MFDQIKNALFANKQPKTLPTLADATRRHDEAAEAHQAAVDALERIEDERGQALLDDTESGDMVTRHTAAKAAFESTLLKLQAAERVYAAAAEAAAEKAAQERMALLDARLDVRHWNALQIDQAIDALAALVQKGQDLDAEISALNPPPSVVIVSIDPARLMQIIACRLRRRPGDTTTAPYMSPEESFVVYYVRPATKPKPEDLN